MAKSKFHAWLYQGDRPNWLARIWNRLYAWIGSSGIMSNYLVTLEVTGRKSGKAISFPVVIALVGGQRYLVSMLGTQAQWVLNVGAAGGKAAIRSGRRIPVYLESVPVDQRAPILKNYVRRAPGGRPHIPVDMRASLEEFAKVAADFPVFRIVEQTGM